jgi:tellurite resistance-related uncharacterized protein
MHLKPTALTLPSDVRPYQRTATFTEATVPAGLLKAHRTKALVWGRIVIEAGQLRLHRQSGEETLLTPELAGIVAPEEEHEVVVNGPVRFWVEFLR